MCAVYVFRSLYLNFGRGTHHIYIILHVAVFNSLLQFEIAMFDFPLQFFTCASICTSEFLRHTTISLIKLLKDIFLHSSIYFMFLATLSAFFLDMSSACHWFLKVSNLFQHLTPGFEPVFMILELVLIHVQPISAFYLWFSAVVQTISWFYHWFLSNSNLCQESYHCFPSNCTIYFSMSIGLQSLLRIFQQLTVSVHLFFPLPGLVFICFFSSVLCLINFHHCVFVFFTFYVHPFSFCSSPVFFVALSLHGLYCDVLFHQF